ncbi:MAG TPA: phosphodiester glycosidase family protein, partial [Fimbriimonadaceae bacterium]|nr:phosphodiester glycosidase family protein [Fimbriimonadaceae bacterium]
NNRHPRTAVGRTRKGDVWFVTIDGRQALSAGATLEEAARIMIKLGCVEAVNLDGGGSTTFHLFGMTLNRPSDGKEREVANGVLFFGKSHPPSTKPLAIKGPAKLVIGKAETMKLLRGGVPLPNSSVIWEASGAGWIDQGGLLRPTSVGTVQVTAWCESQTARLSVQVAEAPKPPAKKKKPVKRKRRR